MTTNLKLLSEEKKKAGRPKKTYIIFGPDCNYTGTLEELGAKFGIKKGTLNMSYVRDAKIKINNKNCWIDELLEYAD